MNAALPLVIDRLLTVLPGLAGWSTVTVLDGPTLTRDAFLEYVTVGFVNGEDFGGSFEATETLGDLVEEAGSVRSEIVSQTGDDNIKGCRDRVFELFNAWNAWVRANPTLGLSMVSSASLSADLQPVQNSGGSAVRLAVTLTYTSRGV